MTVKKSLVAMALFYSVPASSEPLARMPVRLAQKTRSDERAFFILFSHYLAIALPLISYLVISAPLLNSWKVSPNAF